jgi:hypothetical protein
VDSFSFQVNIGKTPETAMAGYLDAAMRDLVRTAKLKCRKKTVQIYYTRRGRYSANLIVRDSDVVTGHEMFSQEEWAMGAYVSAPSGGLKPSNGGAFMIKKPWGELRWRSRNYTHYTGRKKVPGSGFVKDAIQEVFTPSRLKVLGRGLSQVVMHSITAGMATKTGRGRGKR